MEIAAVLIIAGIFIGSLLFIIFMIKNFMFICRPHEILIFSGRKRTLADGAQVGYRVIFGGRALRIPVLEKVDRMDMTIMPIYINIDGAYSKGNIPLSVTAVANVKITNNPKLINHAIERFLNQERNAVMRVAKETLEGTLRSVLARLTPEQVNEDRLTFAIEFQKEVTEDLDKMGIQVDTFKIQAVSDDVKYLDSIGRKQIAQAIRDAEISESNAKREAEQAIADARGKADVARQNAGAAIQKKQNELRKIRAELEAKAKSEEERADASAKQARAHAEQELQTIRIDLEQLRLQADVVIPAEASRERKHYLAAGKAASIAENGKALAWVLKQMGEAWKKAGNDAMDIFLLQQIETILYDVAQCTKQLQMGEITLLDSGDGSTLPNYINSFPSIVGELLATIKNTVGIDIAATLTQRQHKLDAPKSPNMGTPRKKHL